ncbi:MAG: cation diffusion facilitator family transporter [Deltaproteobacteria bacterium]|nr:cation diffusion facilitator family transporter [Deltaproteobacteria bacterium]
MEHMHHPKTTTHDGHHHAHGHRGEESKRLKLVILLTGFMMVVEGVAGVMTNSLALLSDAFHMLTHFGALLISLGGILIATRFTSEDKTFGYWRAEILTALLNGITLIPIVGYILYESYQRFLHPKEISEIPMLVVAFAGLLVNLISAALLWKTGEKDINMRGAFIHMMGDTLSSVAVIAAGALIYFTGWVLIDPVASAIIGVMILLWSAGLINESVHILLESVPKGIKIEEVAMEIRGLDRVRDVHDIHIWQITSGMYSMTCHVVMEEMPFSEAQRILHRIHHLLDEKFHISHANIQMEGEGYLEEHKH